MAAEAVYGGGDDDQTISGGGGGGDRAPVSRDAAVQALNSIVQLHFEKALEKKRAVAAEKQELARLHHLYFIFLAVSLAAVSCSSGDRLRCRHAWAPITLLSFAAAVHYAAAAKTLRAINGLRYQRRCHKLTLALATDRIKRVRVMNGSIDPSHFEIHYQEPPETYLAKFKRSWALHFAFLLATLGIMVGASVHVICF